MPFPIFRRNIQQPATPTAPAAAAALSAAIAQSAAAPVQQTAALSILGNPTTATTTATSLTLTAGVSFSGTTSVGLGVRGASTLMGNPTTASAVPSDITLGTGLTFSGSTLNAATGSGANLWPYRAKTTTTSGDPANGYLIWNSSSQTAATQINLSHLTQDDLDIDLFFSTMAVNDTIFVQDRDDSTNYQKWTIASALTINATYAEVPVTYVTSGGTGATNFANNHSIVVARFSAGSTGTVTRVDTGTGLTGGPITGAGTVSVAAFGITTGLLATSSVTYPKIQAETALTLLGNPTTASATVSEITLGGGLAFTGSTLTCTVTGGGTGTITQIDTGTGLTGGPITAAGTVSITVSGVTTSLIADAAVTYAKIQAVSASSLLGNPTTASATASEITLGANLAFSGSTLVATASAFVRLDSKSLAGVNTVSFSSFSNAYTDLVVVVRGRSTTTAINATVLMKFNNDSGGNYDYEHCLTDGNGGAGAPAAAGVRNTTSIIAGYVPAASGAATDFGGITAEIYNYNDSSNHKAATGINACRNSTASVVDNFIITIAGWWHNATPAAITRVDVTLGAGNGATGSTVALYGRL